MVVVLIVAAGAAWESRAMGLLSDRSGIVVLKRCVDVDELLGAATAGQAQVAVVALEAPGLDQAAVDLLNRHHVRPVAVAAEEAAESARMRASRLGIASLVLDSELDRLPDVVETAEADVTAVPGPVPAQPAIAAGQGRIVVVWGPGGAPGRTTLAAGLAAGAARRGLRSTLIDVDPYAGTVAQHLGILDETSGLLSAARLASSGVLEARFGSVQRAVDDRLTVVTGLPRPDRWVEVRAGVVEHLLEVAAGHGQVVVDTGFSLEDDPAGEFGSRPARNQMTLDAVGVADEVVVVGSADPVGLSRLARGLVELREVLSGAPVRVVVNRMRPTLGWSETDIVGMVEGFTRLTGVHFLPDDRSAIDRALVAGRSVADGGDSPLANALGGVVDAVFPQTRVTPRRRGWRRGGVRRRRAGRGRRP